MDLAGKIIVFSIGLYVAGSILPDAITNIVAVNTTTWSTAGQNLWAVVEIIAVVCIILLLYRVASEG